MCQYWEHSTRDARPGDAALMLKRQTGWLVDAAQAHVHMALHLLKRTLSAKSTHGWLASQLRSMQPCAGSSTHAACTKTCACHELGSSPDCVFQNSSVCH